MKRTIRCSKWQCPHSVVGWGRNLEDKARAAGFHQSNLGWWCAEHWAERVAAGGKP